MKIPKDTLDRIINLARKLEAENADSFARETPVALSEFTADDLKAGPTELALIDLIDSVSDEEKAELEAIFFLGRGDFADFEQAKAYALQNGSINAAIYLTEKAQLGRVFGSGLRRHLND